MEVQHLIKQFINTQPQGKRQDIKALHALVAKVAPGCKLWFDEGKNAEGKTVTNPTIGYGEQVIKYANGTVKPYFKIGVSANQSGISVYILGIKDKEFLKQAYSTEIGKAKITGYCIKFNKLEDINIEVLEAALRYGFVHTDED